MTGFPNIFHQPARKIRNLWRDIGWEAGLGQNVLKSATGQRILVYHGICFADPFRFNTLFITQKNLRKAASVVQEIFQPGFIG